MDQRDIWRNYLSLALLAGSLRDVVEELLELLRDRPGFAEEFDEIIGRVLRNSKNSPVLQTVPIDDEAYAATRNLENLNHLIKKWRRDIGHNQQPPGQ